MTSFLLPIDFEGAGSEHVESQSSYIARLAKRHRTSINQLCAMLTDWGSREHLPSIRPGSLYHCQVSMNGYGPAAASFTTLLNAALRRSDTSVTTLQCFECVAAKNLLGGLKHGRAWCPACWREAATPYDRLLFLLKPITRCPWHQILLLTSCPNCQSKQPRYRSSGTVTQCCHCGHDLITPPNQWVRTTKPAFGERELVKCLRFTVLDSSFRYSHGAPLKFHERYIERVEKALPIESRGRLLAIPRMRVGKRPALMSILQLALCAGVGLHELLMDPAGAADSASLEPVFALGHEPKTRERHSARERRAVKWALDKALADPTFPATSSFKRLCGKLGVSPGYVLYWFGDRAADIIGRRVALKKARRENLMDGIRAAVKAVGVSGYFSGKWRSYDDAADALKLQYGFPMRVVRDEIARQCGNARYKTSAKPAQKNRQAYYGLAGFDLPVDEPVDLPFSLVLDKAD